MIWLYSFVFFPFQNIWVLWETTPETQPFLQCCFLMPLAFRNQVFFCFFIRGRRDNFSLLSLTFTLRICSHKINRCSMPNFAYNRFEKIDIPSASRNMLIFVVISLSHWYEYYCRKYRSSYKCSEKWNWPSALKSLPLKRAVSFIELTTFFDTTS